MSKSRIVRPLVCVALAVGAVGCASDKSVISQAADSHRTLEPQVIEDKQLADYVQKVGERVVASAKQVIDEDAPLIDDKEDLKARVYKQDPSWMFAEGGVKFHLVNSKTLNAFTTGGTHVYLYSELFRETRDEDEFAAVVAHEFSHIVARHVAKGMNRQYGILGVAAAAGVGGYALGGDNKAELATAAAGGAMVAGQFVGMGFTRGDEGEADLFGFNFYCNGGWDPDQFGGFFQTLIDKGLDQKTDLTSDHPLLKDRVAKAKARADEWKKDHPNWESIRKPDIADAATFKQLQQRAASIPPPPQTKATQAASLMFNSFPSCVATTPQPQQTAARKELAQIVESNQTTGDARPAKHKKKSTDE